MKSTSNRALAVICLVTLVAAGCVADRVTGPDPDLSAAAAAGENQGGMAADGVEKVTICHIPPGNPENAHTITVGAPAVEAHVTQHGDSIGECEEEPPE
jgi:hypothetical protein